MAVVAHRTSPTNMGLSLLANLAAYDFGYLPAGGLIARTGAALGTMTGLERHRGHFFNWYDTHRLEPLEPRYVSSVDSGNLAAHLSTLQPGLLVLIDAPILNPRWLEGIGDTWAVLSDALAEMWAAAPASERRSGPSAPLERFGQQLKAAGLAPPTHLSAARDCLEALTVQAEAALREREAAARSTEAAARESKAAMRESEAETWETKAASPESEVPALGDRCRVRGCGDGLDPASGPALPRPAG